MEKFYSSKTLLKLAGGEECIPHIPPPPGSATALSKTTLRKPRNFQIRMYEQIYIKNQVKSKRVQVVAFALPVIYRSTIAVFV